MSVKVFEMVWRARMDAMTKIVALRLGDFADDDGGSIYPSVPRVSRDCGASERTIQSALRRLEIMGVLILVREADFSRRRAREYRLDLAALADLAAPDTDRCSTFTGEADAPVKQMHRCSKFTPPVQELHPTGAGAAPQPSENPPVEPSERIPPQPPLFELVEPSRSESQPDIGALFAEWWRAVPRKVARGAALRAYRSALKQASPAELLAGITRYAAEVAGREQRYIAHPASWLNAQRWLDEPARVHGDPHERHHQAPGGQRRQAWAVAAERHVEERTAGSGGELLD